MPALTDTATTTDPPAPPGAPPGTFTADIDIGGTLTDGLFSDGTRLWTVKVDTTPHDFTVCFFDCLRAGSELVGFPDLTSFLERVSIIRWSATIATNVLAERKGPRIGLMVGAGHEDDLYGEGTSPALGHVLDAANVAPITPADDPEQILEKVRGLLERGVRRICTSLEGSFEDDARELEIKAMIEQQFPDHYVGSVPVLLGSEIVRHPNDNTRTHVALVNAYVHTPLASALFRAEDELLARHRYRKPLYIGHVNGGVARVAKTKGVETIESGPVFGSLAAAHLARAYGLDRVLTLDVGGTTAKLGVIVDGECLNAPRTDFFGIPAELPWMLLRSAALGGGSVARVSDGKVTLGPDSMGAYPGPACYDLGGGNATITDAFLIAGRLNGDRFLGGSKTLDAERAAAALEEHVATPLGVLAPDAALAVIDTAMDIVADVARRTLDEGGYAPDGFALFCFGGNGGNFAAGVAERLGIENAYALQLGPVLSTFGSSVSDVQHIHEEWPYFPVGDADVEQRAVALMETSARAVRYDLEGEGMAAGEARFDVELTFLGDDGESLAVSGPVGPGTIADALSKAPAGSVVQRLKVRGASVAPHFDLAHVEPEPHAAEAAGVREAHAGRLEVYDWASLRPGATLTGPAMLESNTHSCMVPEGWQATINGYNDAVLARASGESR
jgi:acetophenone carboxylase